MMLAATTAQAQTARQQLKAQPATAIVNLSQTVTDAPAEGTSFGDRLVERLKAEGIKLPMAEEKMRRLRPGHRSYVRPVAEGEKPLTFSGMLQYNEVDGRMLLEYGFYKFSQVNGFVREPMADVDFDLNGRGAYYNHKLHGVASINLPYTGSNNARWTYCEWDTDTWEPTGMHGTTLNAQNFIVKAADWDPTTGICYGWKQDGSSGNSFLRIDYENMSREIVTTSDSTIVMLAINSKGQMYGVTDNGSFCSIDKQSGRLTYVGSLDFPFEPILESMTFDRKTDRLYMAATEVDYDEELMFGRLCEVDVKTGHTELIAYLPEVEEYTCLNVLYEPDGEAPADIEQMMVSFPSEVGTGVGLAGFTIPKTTVSGEPLTGTVHYVLTFNDDDANPIEGDAQPGDYVAKIINPKGDGRQKVVVVLTAGGHEGRRNVAVGWVGTDTPMPTNIQLAYNEESGEATLTWAGNVGQHGGFVKDALTYDVYRMPGEVKVASATTKTTFTESLADMKYNGYYYKIVPFRDDVEGVSATSDIIKVGQPHDVPFTDDFEDADAGTGYTVIDQNGDGTSWDFIHFDSTSGRMRYNYAKYAAADDWVLTPPIHLMEGIAYEVKFLANSISPAFKERLAVACGIGDDPSAYEVLIPETVVSTTNHQSPIEMTGEIKVKQTGDYHFAFHCTSPALQNALMIDNLSVTAGQLLITPDSVKNLQLAAAQDGDLIVTIDFDAPTVANDGTQLESLSRIVITRGEQQDLVATLTDVKPGQHYTVVDEDAVNGQVVYGVTAYNEAGAGLTATASVYVGTDAPAVPQQVALADNLDGTATLSWQAPTQGQNGGYVDTEELTYNVYGVINNQLTKVKSDVTDMTYTVSGVPQTGAQGQTIYGVSAVNELGESNAALAAPLIHGAPYTLPFMEGFLSSGLKGIWATRSNDASTSWRMYSGMSSDGDNCLTAVESEKIGAVATLTSGKVTMAGAVTPKLVFAAYGDPGSKNVLKVAIQKNGEAQADTVMTLNFADQKEEAFVVCSIDLSAYKEAKYVTASFVAELNDPQLRLIAIDDVNFRNVNQYDLAVYADVQSRTTAGQKAHVDVTVHNVGDREAKGYQVSVFVNGQNVKSFEADGPLASFDRARYAFDYQTVATDPAESRVWAVVSYDYDLDEDDNTTAEQTLRIVASQLEAVTGLVAASADGKSLLQWTPVTGKNSVTESFEGYETFSKSFGQWGNYDQDRTETAGINGLWWPGMNQPQAFLTFNFREAGVTEAQMKAHPEFEANTGSQFLACFKANNAPGNKNNDWLVSPELSGEEQTVTIFAQSLAGVWNETFEVLYSTEGNQVSDFKADNLVNEYEAPKSYFGRFRANLPAGAKYFAIHCNSQNGGVFMLDDISYEGKALTLRGYNIYCDGQLVGTAEAGAQTYEHNVGALSTGLHTYHVTALYDEGESALSNAAPVAVVNAIKDVSGRQLQIAARQGSIEVSGAKGMTVAVYTLAGQLCFKGKGDAVVPVAAGQYLVVVDGHATNVLVK